MKNYSYYLTAKIADYNDRFDNFLAESQQIFKEEAAKLFPDFQNYVFALGREDIEIKANYRWGCNFRIYLDNGWDWKEGDPIELKLSTTGSSYKLNSTEADEIASFYVIAFQGFVANDLLKKGYFHDAICTYFLQRKAIEAEYEAISAECEKETRVRKEMEKVEYMTTQFDELFKEGAIFAVNKTFHSQTALERAVFEQPEQKLEVYRIEKITNKIVKGGGANYASLRYRAMNNGEQTREMSECFWGDFWEGKKQTDRKYLTSAFVNGKLVFCSLLPFDHPVCQSSQN